MNTTSIPVIAIDGPSASGKGTVAQLVAEKLGFHYLDSGALYRIVALAASQRNIDWANESAVTNCAKALHIQFTNGGVFLNGNDVSEAIRDEEMGKGASQVAVHPDVRAALVDLQHNFQQFPGLVADGRDMGTIIFPDAQLKIFLTASVKTRAQRRYAQLLAKNQPANYPKILLDLQERDTRDKNRASAPLMIAADAILLETDHRSISDAVEFVLSHYKRLI